MFILEEPYVSDYLIETLNKNNYPVFENEMVKGRANNTVVEILNEKTYTNSENAFDAILKSQKNSNYPKYITLFKDKAKTREILKNIYPDFFYREVSFSELSALSERDFHFPLVIKPSVGFLSFGVETVYEHYEFKGVIEKIKASMKAAEGLFPKSVLSSDKFILEEFIKGDEYAVDVYFDENSAPVILNIYKHPFADKFDVSDRMYITSYDIIQEKLGEFTALFEKIGKLTGLKNFPCHIELRSENGRAVPIEVNPMRFAGWCLCDLAYYAYGINPYEYFMEGKKPNWQNIKSSGVYAFVMCEVPALINKSEIISFDTEKFKKDTNAEILEVREYDFKVKPMFNSMFIRAKSYEDIKHILKLKTQDYTRVKISAI